MLITRLEHSELLDHLEQSDDLWMQSVELDSLWLRSDGEASLCALRFVEADPVVHVEVLPLVWTLEDSEAYLLRLVEHWTSYPYRKSVEAFLRDELHVDAPTAELAAIALLQLEAPLLEGPVPDLPEIPVKSPPPEVALFQLAGGGYVELLTRGGLLHATLSVPSNRQHSSFGPPLTGVFRTHRIHTQNAAAAIAREESA